MFYYLITMRYIDMYLIYCILYHSNVCDNDRNSYILLFNLYMQCHYIALSLIIYILLVLIYLGVYFTVNIDTTLGTRVMVLIIKQYTVKIFIQCK